MGTQRHHAIVISGQEDHLMVAAHNMAVSLELPTTPIVRARYNGWSSFCVVPDGSNEGWVESNLMDESRAVLIRWLTAHRQFDWIEVSFADEQGPSKILRDSSGGRFNNMEVAPIGGGG